jgi:hypothetical protein
VFLVTMSFKLVQASEPCQRERDLYRKTVNLQNDIIAKQAEENLQCRSDLDMNNAQLTEKMNEYEKLKRRCLVGF